MNLLQWVDRIFSKSPDQARRDAAVHPAIITAPADDQPRPRLASIARPAGIARRNPPANDWPAWFVFAIGELGETEIAGAKHNSRIVEYLRAGGLPYASDETPWCAAFVNWCLQQAGLPGTARPNARSFMGHGEPIDVDQARVGDIVVLWRGDPLGWQGHVGFYVDRDAHRVQLLGGNQSDAVTEKWYSRDRVLGVFRPAA